MTRDEWFDRIGNLDLSVGGYLTLESISSERV